MQGLAGRVLVVDDVEMNRDVLARRLRQQGHTVATAENGRRALEMLAAEEFDLVLLDIMMPELDGFQVLERLRQDEALRHIPVIMISAMDEMPSVVRAIELGAADYLPKPFNAVLLKARVGATLEKKRLADAERLHARSLERELEIGRQIQASFLPEELPQPPGWEIAASFHPARKVGGDFYDAFHLPRRGRLGLAVSDVCDKGVGAALFMAVFRSLIRTAIERNDEAGAEVAANVEAAAAHNSDYIARTHGKANMFATLFLAVLDLESGALTYVNAGHEPPVVRRASGAIARFPPTGPAVGLLPGLRFRVEETTLSPGDLLLAFTDGVSEARNPAGELYGEARLLALLEGPPAAAPALLSRIEGSLRAHTAGGEPSDDVTMLAVRRRQ
ncbi:MAG: PP2C family protein-serine/threonine phosphatase [Acidobacteriota bacterium]